MNRPWHYLFPVAIASALVALPVAAQLSPDVLPEDVLPAEEEVEEIRRYSVEVIVFEYTSSARTDNELFEPVPLPEPEFADDMTGLDANGEAVVEYGDFVEMPVEDEGLDLNVELEEIPSLDTVAFRMLAPEEMSMADIHKRLETLDAYNPVLWGGWSQAVVDETVTPAIRLRILGTPPLDIDGSFTLYLKNYLHLVVDLTLEERIATIEPVYRQERGGYQKMRPDSEHDYDSGSDYPNRGFNSYDYQKIVYQILEDRIFRSGELRYYDHPKFGVLARVYRVEDTGEQEDDSADGPTMLSR